MEIKSYIEEAWIMISLNNKLSKIEQGCGKVFIDRNMEAGEFTCNGFPLCKYCEEQKKLLLEVIKLDKGLKKEYDENSSNADYWEGYNQALKDLLGSEKDDTTT